MLILVISLLITLLRSRGYESNDIKDTNLDILWREFVHIHDIAEHLANRWLRNIKSHYRESQRYYHTVSHIQQMLDLFVTFRGTLNNPDAVFLAILFHDVIYNPRAGDNEELSAVEFERFYIEVTQDKDSTLKLAVNNTMVSQYILATKTHNVSDNSDQDLLMFLDFDMSILGSTEVQYERYSQQIRYEYQYVPLGIYTQRRSEVLKGFLTYPAIFNTDSFRVTHEQTARNNIAREISHLTEEHEEYESKQDL